MQHEPVTPSAGRGAPPWIFAITNLPFGVAGGYLTVAMPFLLRNAGLSVDRIEQIVALGFVPAAWQLLWAPVVDLRFRRRVWLVLVSCLGALCLGFSLTLELPEHLVAFEVLMVTGQLLVGLVSSCNGALISTCVAEEHRGRAAGWVNAGNLGAAALGGGAVITLSNLLGTRAAAIGLVLMIILPSLAAFFIPEAAPAREKLLPHLGHMAKDVWRAVSARRGWTGLLFCISPVGTAALTNAFSALGTEYSLSDHVIEWVNGYGGGLVTAFGALLGGYLLDRIERRKAYMLSGALTAVCGVSMALAPLTPKAYVVGVLAYMLVTGFCYAAFSAVVFEIVGTAGTTASTLYSVFPAAGNQAIAYTTSLNGLAFKQWGVRGLMLSDAVLNVVGIFALLLLMRWVFRGAQAAPDNTASSGFDALAEVAGG